MLLQKQRPLGIHALRMALSYLVLLAGAALMVLPFLWSVATSLKPAAEVFRQPAFWVPLPLDLTAYRDVLERVNIGLYGFNTFKVALLITIGQLITCSLSGFAFAKIRFPGRDVLFLVFLSTMMVPAAVTLIPNFVVMKTLNLRDTHASLILPFLGSAYGTFLMRQFFLTFPDELQDAAELDGCNPFGFYYHILLPNSKPILATLGLLTFQAFWNEFQWTLIMINSEPKRTLQLGLSYLLNENYINWPWLMAGAVLTTLPIIVLFIITQKQFVESIKFSGLKG